MAHNNQLLSFTHLLREINAVTISSVKMIQDFRILHLHIVQIPNHISILTTMNTLNKVY
jgi:hypothetical protein